MTLYAWARENGVVTHSLYRWRERVSRLDARASRGGEPEHQAKRRSVGEDEARRLLTAWEAAGVPLAEWCRAQGVSSDAMYRWRGKLATSPPRAEGPRLVELTVPMCSEEPESARYELFVGRCRVVVGNDFDDAALARLLRVAAAC